MEDAGELHVDVRFVMTTDAENSLGLRLENYLVLLVRNEVVELVEEATLGISGEDEVELVKDLSHVFPVGQWKGAYRSFW